MKSSRLDHIGKLLLARSEFKEVNDNPQDFFPPHQYQKMEIVISLYTLLSRINYKMQPKDMEIVMATMEDLINTLSVELKEGKEKYDVLNIKIQLWIRLLNSFSMGLYKHKDYNNSIALTTFTYKNLKTLRTIIAQLSENKNKHLKKLADFVALKGIDVLEILGRNYLDQDDHHNSSVYFQKILSKVEEDISLQDERIVRTANIYGYLAKNSLATKNLNGSAYYLIQAQKLIHLQIENFPVLKQYPFIHDHLEILDELINLIPTTNLPLLKEVSAALPSESVDYPIYQTKLINLLKSKMTAKENFDDQGIFELSDILNESKQANIVKYAKDANKFARNKNVKQIKALIKDKQFDKFDISQDEENQHFNLTLKNIPQQAKVLSSVFINEATYLISRKKDKTCYLQIPTTISAQKFNQLVEELNKIEFCEIREEAKVEMASINTQSNKLKEEDIVIEPQEEVSNKKTLKKVKPNQKKPAPTTKPAPTIENKQPKIEPLKSAKDLGFKEDFNNEKIFPLYAKLYPGIIYYGFYSRQNMHVKVAEETHKDNEKVLEIGKVGSKSPCIKYVKGLKDTFKLAPLSDLRVVSHVVDESKDGKKLLCFDAPVTHETQKKKLYK